MAIQNISKYVQINDFLLLEYEFNRSDVKTDLTDLGATVATTTSGFKQYFNNNESYALGTDLNINTNNILEFNSTPTDSKRSNWFNNYNNINRFENYFSSIDPSVALVTDEYVHDTVKVHIVSGYNFDDIAGFLLQVRAKDSSANYVDLSNFTYIKQIDGALNANKTIKFSNNSLYLGNRFYDKYVQFRIPSVYALGNDTAGGFDTSLGQYLNIEPLSDVYLTYSTLPDIDQNSINYDNTYQLAENINFQLPVTSVADNFNVFIAESTNGDYIEYYATWNDQIIGQYMGDIESGRIRLNTSNNPNDNYQEFEEVYGSGVAKWVLNHEIYVYEDLGGQSSILTQKFVFTQDSNYNDANLFRPVLKHADIDATFSIQYICRLTNRMDGTQIIRRASFSSTDPKKYGSEFNRIRVNNIIPYKVFNKIEGEKANILQGVVTPKTKYVKVYYDTTNVVYNQNNEIYNQGTGPMFLVEGDSNYKFKFEKFNDSADKRENADLSGAYNYVLRFYLDDDTKIEVGPTYSNNMNTTIGELEYKLSAAQVRKLLKQSKNTFNIVIKNPDQSEYTFYEGKFYSYAKREAAKEEQQNYVLQISGLNKKITSLEKNYKQLESENAELKNKVGDLRLKAKNSNIGGSKVNIVGPSIEVDNKPTVEIKELNERIDTLEKENAELTKQLTALNLQLNPPEREIFRRPSEELTKLKPKVIEKIYKTKDDPRTSVVPISTSIKPETINPGGSRLSSTDLRRRL